MQAAVKIDEKRHVFWNSKGPRRSRFHNVDTKFVPNRGLRTIEHSKNATR